MSVEDIKAEKNPYPDPSSPYHKAWKHNHKIDVQRAETPWWQPYRAQELGTKYKGLDDFDGTPPEKEID